MKKLLLAISTYLLLFINADAQTFEWARSFGNLGYDYGECVAVDASGNVYTMGNFTGTLDFDPGPGTINLSSAWLQDIYIQKLDASGNFLWAKSFGGLDEDFGHSIAIDAFGNVYTTGIFKGRADFNPDTTRIFNLTSAGDRDIFVQKLDSTGNFVWAKSIGGNYFDVATSITIDDSGNIYTTGAFIGTVDFDPGPGVANRTSSGSTSNSNIFVLKLDSAGNFLWAKSFGGFNGGSGQSISADVLGNIYTTGTFGGIVDFNPNSGIANLSSIGSNDIFIQKLDASGNFLWAKSFGSNIDDEGASIAIDKGGNIYTTGQFRDTVDFDPGTGTNIHIAAGSSTRTDIFIQKLDASGNFLWAKSFGSNHDDEGASIAIDGVGNIYTTGQFRNTVDFDPGTGTAILSSTWQPSIFIQKLDAAGNFIWVKSFAGTLTESGRSIKLDASGNIYTVGHFAGIVDLNPSAGVANHSSVGGSFDVFVHKMSQAITISVTELTPGIKINAYPNPTNGIVQILFEKEFQDVLIKLTDLQGKEVFSKELNTTTNEQITIEGSPGVYFLRVSSKEGQSIIKLIKE